MHGFLGHDGTPPAELTALGRDQAQAYGVEVIDARVTAVTGDREDGFTVEAADGKLEAVARRVVVATGLVDILPEIDGLADHWGTQVIHCPFCHGYEVGGQQVVSIITHPMGLHSAPLFRHLADRLTVVRHSNTDDADPNLALLRDAGVDIVDGPARAVVDNGDGSLTGVELVGGAVVAADAVVVTPRFEARVAMLQPLGLKPTEHSSGLGTFLDINDQCETTTAGVFAAGNVSNPTKQVVGAAADGARAASMVAFSLAEEDARRATAS